VAVTQLYAIFDGRCRTEQREIELPLQPLLHDLHVEQAEEAAAEPEAEGRGGFRFIYESGIVELQLFQRFLELLVLLGVRREKPGEYHRRDIDRKSTRLNSSH